MSEVDNSLVKRGFWINWSQGPIMGRTITTDAATANVLIALLTVMITIATAQFWNLLTFFYHQFRARGLPADGLYWQQQALFRTLPTPTAVIADCAKLWWVWRHKSQQALVRSVLPIALASLFAIGAVSSGIFSTYAVSTSNIEVLVDSPFCGNVNMSQIFDPTTGASTHRAKLIPVTKAYARECYQDRKFLPSRCHNTFARPNISIHLESAECPWAPSMCLPQPSPAISMDSGVLDQSHFGFNVQPHQGISIRKKTVCNVLPLEGYVSVSNATLFATGIPRKLLADEKVIGLHYFYNPNQTLEWNSMTFSASSATVNITYRFSSDGLTLYTQHRDPVLQSWSAPLVEMNRTDADVALNVIWLNTVLYSQPCEDPLFAAHQPRNYTNRNKSFQLYAADNAAGMIGCTEQYQFCIARKGKDDFCAPFQGLPTIDQFTTEMFPGASDLQLVMLRLMHDATDEFNIIMGANWDYTQAGELLTSLGRVPQLPNDQWKREAIGWESLAWAGIQIRLADYGVGPKVRDPDADAYVIPPSTPAEKELCKAVKMRKSGGFANVNVFGLAMILTFSATVSLVNVTVLRFCIFLSRFRRAMAPRLDRWIQDGVFQLQRRAFDAHGLGDWSRLDKEIPATAGGQKLRELPVGSLPAVGLSPKSTFGSLNQKM